MSTPENELEVTIGDEDEPKGAPAEPTAAEPSETDKAIAELKAQIETEKNLRLDAERRAHEASHGEATARAASQDDQKALIENAISNLDSQKEALKAQYRTLRSNADNFDPDAEFEIQNQLSEIAAKKAQLEAGKRALEGQPKPTVRTSTDPVEALASQLTPASADWVRKHPQYARDKNLYNQMIGAHNIAIGKGIAVDSPQYFKTVEKLLEIDSGTTTTAPAKDPEEPGDDVLSAAATPAPKKQPAPPSAPVGRGGNGTAKTYRLTAEEAEIAAACGQTPEEYAKEKMRLKAERQLN